MARIRILTDSITQSNCYIIEENQKAVVIDPNQEKMLIDFLEKQNWQVKQIFLTHEHCDHIRGLNLLRDIYKAPVTAQEECSRGIQNSVSNMSRIMGTYLYFKNGQKEIIDYEPFVCRPADETFLKEQFWSFEGHELRAVSLPGHTPGSSCLILDKTRLFSGDYLLPGEKVVTRLPGGNEEDYEKKAKPFLKKLPLEMLVYPGHGTSFVLSDEVMKDHGL
ncbi:MBL fold metallo-hydrolase [Anaerostipes sp.]|uniref:MBL fold metallo-hydrolase n=1 Tax=Anaerostipes sp. TaxID=1872530 RepID=UPI0025BD498D|nr:MBL fold metallo-hydrolase [Anaerostipes sp.]MBS7009887.1 MBL fold metallo-hydrolase [Anaerostipes sp.]